VPEDPDLSLLRRFAKGDDDALGELAARYERPLLGLAMGILNDRELARDVVQETWLRVIKSAKHFAGASSVKTWVYRILINRALDVRQIKLRTRMGAISDDATSGMQGPEQAAHHLENGQLLRHAVDGLTPDQRLILILSYHEGLSHTAAAEVLDIPVGTLKSRLHAALTQLRARLSPEATP
jgi:RNA polymerase sigma-70 factor (ECF subfamily)